MTEAEQVTRLVWGAFGLYLALVAMWYGVGWVVRVRRDLDLRRRTARVRESVRVRAVPRRVDVVISFRPGSSMPVILLDGASGRRYGFGSLADFGRWSSSSMLRYLDGSRSEGDRLSYSPSATGWGWVVRHPAFDGRRD